MSWKSLVTTGLLCLLASPAFANPTLRVVNGPALQAGTGDWVWTVSIEEGFTGDDGLSPVAGELGFDANSSVVSITPGTEFDGTNTLNPGNVIFGWEDLTDLTGTGDCSAGVFAGGQCPVGIQSHLTDAQTPAPTSDQEIFSAVGSETDGGFSGQQTYLTIVTSGPSNAALTGSLQVLGAYGAGTDEGRIAELAMVSIDGGAAEMKGLNYNGYTGTASRTLKNGDISLDGLANDSDFAIFVGKYSSTPNPQPGGWTVGDFNRDGQVNDSDFAIFVGQYSATNTIPGDSISNLTDTGSAVLPAGWALAGGGGSAAVPEPASIAILALGLLSGLGLVRRRQG